MAEKKFYTQWWFFVIIGVVLLVSIGLLSGGNNQLLQEQKETINLQQDIINNLNETTVKDLDAMRKLMIMLDATEKNLVYTQGQFIIVCTSYFGYSESDCRNKYLLETKTFVTEVN